MPEASPSNANADAVKPAVSPIDSPGADLTGRTLGEFEILRKIGAGGMGQVYLARQLSLKRQVALKLLRKDLAGNATAMQRFEAEAIAVARLNHPNIVQVYGAGESDGLRYMALEYVEGRNLREHLARRGPLELSIALSIMRQVATALKTAHEQGLVHRDIKPENILVTKKVEVKVTDFGLSRFFTDAEAIHLTQSGITLGTPLYLSPEQAQGHSVDHRSDLYSFGVTSYHLLCGEPPFRGTTAVEVALKHLTDHAKPLADLRPDLPPDLCALVHKLMAKRVEDRYQSAKDLLRDLAKVKEGRSVGLNLSNSPATPPTGTVPLFLSTSHPVVAGSTLTGLSNSVLSPAAPVRWIRWTLATFACLLACAIGAIGYVLVHPKPSGPAAKAEPTPIVGLPDIKPPEKIVTSRERELLAIIKDRSTTPDHWITTSIELGLLYLHEGRLDESSARFEAMEKEAFALAPIATNAAHVSGRIGKAIVLAHRDTDPQTAQAAAQESVKQFQTALPKGKGEGLRLLLFRHGELAQAAADALKRNEANGAKVPKELEALRSPKGLTKKD
jgi:serine/threonine protein kinase